MASFFTNISTMFGVMGTLQEGNALASQYLAQAAADNFNAEVADQLAFGATERAAGDAIDYRRSTRGQINSAFAERVGGSGFSVAEGTPRKVDEALFQEMELGIQRIVHGGQVESTRQRTQGILLRAQAKANKMSAKNAKTASQIKAFGTAARGFGAHITLAAGDADKNAWGLSTSSGGPTDIRPFSPFFGSQLSPWA